MKNKIPFTNIQLKKIIKNYPTPLYIYDEDGIVLNARNFNDSFSWNKGFKEFFAVKALPNPYILEILKKEGFGVDCSSLPELLLAEAVGFKGEEIMFTSNNTPAKEYKKAFELNAIINLDDITHIDFLKKSIGIPEIISFRFNPGKLKKGNLIIGDPIDSKFGLTKEQIIEAYSIAKSKGVKRFGIHIMAVSNELDPNYFIETANIMFDLVIELSKKIGISFEFINLGGGIGIPYKKGQKKVNLEYLSRNVQLSYEKKLIKNNLNDIKIFMENGRVITGPYGYLISTVIHKKNTYKHYLGLDANMANLLRATIIPGAYHQISVLGKKDEVKLKKYDVVGSLCTNMDKLAIDRMLPEVEVGDLVIVQDTGAHSHSMGFNYNGKLRSAELLLLKNRKLKLIRRAENVDDYFSTLNYPKLKKLRGVN